MSRREALEGASAMRVEDLLGWRIAESRRVRGGYTAAERWVVGDGRGRSAFAKRATTPGTAEALRQEHAVYRSLEGDFMPRLLAFDDDGEHPLLLIEDLSEARWPPPWDAELVEAVLRALDRLHARRAPLPRFEDRVRLDFDGLGWAAVAADPRPFLSLGIRDARWLDRALPILRGAEASVPDGDVVTHFDVRSDNLCATERGVVLIDWNLACLGNPELDTGFWLPSLELEGGPPPEAVLPHAPGIAAWVSGFFAARAGLPPVPDAPRVRAFQREQAVVSLAWARRALALPASGAD